MTALFRVYFFTTELDGVENIFFSRKMKLKSEKRFLCRNIFVICLKFLETIEKYRNWDSINFFQSFHFQMKVVLVLILTNCEMQIWIF